MSQVQGMSRLLSKTKGVSDVLMIRSIQMDVKPKAFHSDGTELLEENLSSKNPIELFSHWYEKARNTPDIPRSHAMTLSTVQKDNRPSSRMVLLQGFDEKGFKFYTSCFSAKAGQLAVNPFAALLFYWMPLNRSVRIEGKVEAVPPAEADADFDRRTRQSQLSMHVSEKQSQPVRNRTQLLEALQAVSKLYEGRTVPRPSFIRGYRVVPDRLEFWQGHDPTLICDRIVFTKNSSDFSQNDGNDWTFERLGP